MRYEAIQAKHGYTQVDVAAVWPAGLVLAPGLVPELQKDKGDDFVPTPAAPDVPAAVGKLIVGSYVALLAAFALATAASAYSIFMITIGALFLVAFFAVPWIFFRQEPRVGARPSLARFMDEGMETLTGHSTGKDALVQMLIVPVLLTLGVSVIGVAAALTL